MPADVPTRGGEGSGGIRADRADPTLIFLHIGKTAGSTLRQVLQRQFPRSQVLTVRARRRPREETLADFAQLPVDERMRPRLIMGHTVFGLHRSIPRPSTYLTMMRHPLRLALSQYAFVLRTPGHRHHELVQGMSLEEYIRSGIALEMDNSQTRAIAGDVGTPFAGCGPDMLETAIRNLTDHFAFVGLTERFDESLLMLRATFGWRNVFYVSANVARARPQPTGAERELIEAHNQLDLQLYEWVAERFDEAVQRDPGFQTQLRRFVRRNALYQPWGNIAHTWPAAARQRVRRERV
jgi:hypothetical protein